MHSGLDSDSSRVKLFLLFSSFALRVKLSKGSQLCCASAFAETHIPIPYHLLTTSNSAIAGAPT